MEWFGKHWAALFGILLSALYIYLQLVVWKRHGDDLMLIAANIVITCSLWMVLLIAIGRYWKHGKNAELAQEKTRHISEIAELTQKLQAAESPKQLTAVVPDLATRAFDLARRFNREAKQFHRQNPQPPSPSMIRIHKPAQPDTFAEEQEQVKVWSNKASGWYRTRFYSDLQRMRDELAVQGLSDTQLDVSIERTLDIENINRIVQKLRLLASQVEDHQDETR
jgi:hypothetical protein